VLWTEEGHRLSWRMMLRAKVGFAVYKVIDKETKKEVVIKLENYLSKKQIHLATTHPDVIWQFSQYLKQEYKKNGQDIAVYVRCSIRTNASPYKQLIDPEIDMASVKWNAFSHSDWILPSKLD
jgi:hypothetical protein